MKKFLIGILFLLLFFSATKQSLAQSCLNYSMYCGTGSTLPCCTGLSCNTSTNLCDWDIAPQPTIAVPTLIPDTLGLKCMGKPGLCKTSCEPNIEEDIGQEDCDIGERCCKSIAQPLEGIPSPDCKTNSGKTGIDTALGCIPVESTDEFLGWVLGWAVGVGGGIAFLLIIYASFMIMTSSGNPERLKAGQELLTSAISGLIMLVFSIFILNFIGIDILHLDQWGFGN